MDPILTGLVGAAAKEELQAANDPRLRHALLLPVTTVVGQRLAEAAEDWFHRQKERRQSNLEGQLKLAAASGNTSRIEEIADSPEFFEWARGASEVEPQDEELTALWQSVLKTIQERSPLRKKFLKIAKSIEPDELNAFITYAAALKVKKFKTISEQYVYSLEKYGLLQPFIQKYDYRSTIYATATFVCVVIEYNLFTSLSSVTHWFPSRWMSDSVISIMALVLIGYFIMTLRGFLSPRKLTAEGNALHAYLTQIMSSGETV